MASTATLEYLIKVNDRDLKELKGRIKDTNDAFEDSEKKSSKFAGALGGVAKGAAFAAGGAALGGLFATIKVGIADFKENQEIAAQTEAVLKSTGGAAKVTADEVNALAGAIAAKSGVDDAAIQKGQNLLLTFTGIRNEAGKGNDIFNQATQIMTDMSVAMGTDASASAIGLGKALNDPTKGVTALTRVGVTFTDEQKKMITEMQKAGDTAGAQKIILAELQKEFGGSAEAAGKTFGGQLNILKMELEGVAGSIISGLMPYLTQFVGFITEKVIPWIKNFKANLTGGGDGGLKGAFAGVGDFIENVWFPILRGIAGVFKAAFDAVIRIFNENEKEIKTIINGITTVIKGIGLVLEEVVLPLLKKFFADGGPFDLVFSSAIKIVSGVVRVIAGIAGAISSAVEGVVKFWNGKGKPAWDAVFGAIKEPVQAVLGLFESIVDKIESILRNAGKLKGAFGWLPGVGSEIGKRPPAVGLTAPLAGVTSKLWDEIALGNAMGLTVTSGLREGDPGDHGRGHAVDMAGSFGQMAAFATALFGRSGLKDVIYGELGVWQDNGRMVMGWAGNESLRANHAGSNAHVHLSAFHKGGIVPGNREVPALLMGGEGVFTREQMAAMGGRIDLHNHIYLDRQEVGYLIRDEIARIGSNNVSTGL